MCAYLFVDRCKFVALHLRLFVRSYHFEMQNARKILSTRQFFFCVHYYHLKMALASDWYSCLLRITSTYCITTSAFGIFSVRHLILEILLCDKHVRITFWTNAWPRLICGVIKSTYTAYHWCTKIKHSFLGMPDSSLISLEVKVIFGSRLLWWKCKNRHIRVDFFTLIQIFTGPEAIWYELSIKL